MPFTVFWPHKIGGFPLEPGSRKKAKLGLPLAKRTLRDDVRSYECVGQWSGLLNGVSGTGFGPVWAPSLVRTDEETFH